MPQRHHTAKAGPFANLVKVDLLYSTHALKKRGLFENLETTMQHFRAFYEDAAKVEAAAKALGFTGNDGESWHDFVESENGKYRTGKTFPTLVDAEQWLKTEIAAVKSVYGCGTIRLQEPIGRRCRYCVCSGVRNVHEYTVDDTGIVEDEPMEDLCHDG